MSDIVIGIDLGGTRIKAVAIDKSGNLLHQHYHPTHDGDDLVWKTAISGSVREIQEKTDCPGAVVGISAPGLPNGDNSAIAYK